MDQLGRFIQLDAKGMCLHILDCFTKSFSYILVVFFRIDSQNEKICFLSLVTLYKNSSSVHFQDTKKKGEMKKACRIKLYTEQVRKSL